MAVAIPILMVAGAAISAYGAMQQGQAQAKAATYNAQLRERDAGVARQQTSATIETQRRHAEQVQGSLVADYGATGLGNEGSPMDVLRMSITNAKLDEHTIRYRGELQAMGMQESATLDRMQAKTAKDQSYVNSASSLLTGVGNAYYSDTVARSGRSIRTYE